MSNLMPKLRKIRSGSHLSPTWTQLGATWPEVQNPKAAKLAQLGPKLDQDGFILRMEPLSHEFKNFKKQQNNLESRVPEPSEKFRHIPGQGGGGP